MILFDPEWWKQNFKQNIFSQLQTLLDTLDKVKILLCWWAGENERSFCFFAHNVAQINFTCAWSFGSCCHTKQVLIAPLPTNKTLKENKVTSQVDSRYTMRKSLSFKYWYCSTCAMSTIQNQTSGLSRSQKIKDRAIRKIHTSDP